MDNVLYGALKSTLMTGLNVLSKGFDNTGTVSIVDKMNVLSALYPTAETTLYFPDGTYKIGANYTVPSNFTITRSAGAKFVVDAGVTFNLGSCKINNNDLTEFFAGEGKVYGKINSSVVYQEWFNDTLKNNEDNIIIKSNSFGEYNIEKDLDFNNINDLNTLNFYCPIEPNITILSNTLTVEQYTASMQACYDYGFRNVILSIYYDFVNDSATDNNANLIVSNEFFEAFVDKALQIGLTPIAIKYHCGNIDRNPTVFSTFISNYANTINYLGNVCVSKGIEYICISNELSNVTDQGLNDWVSIIKNEQSKGLKTFSALLTNYEVDRISLELNTFDGGCVFIEYLDVIGLNIYTPLIDSGDTATLEYCRNYLYNNPEKFYNIDYMDRILKLKEKYPDKEFWITETGVSKLENNLSNPPVPSNFYGNDKYDYLQQYFYETILPFLGQKLYKNNPFFTKIFFWNISTLQSSFNWIGNEVCEKSVKKYLKGYAKYNNGLKQKICGSIHYDHDRDKVITFDSDMIPYDFSKTRKWKDISISETNKKIDDISVVESIANGTLIGYTLTNLLGSNGTASVTIHKTTNLSITSKEYTLSTTARKNLVYTLSINITQNDYSSNAKLKLKVVALDDSEYYIGVVSNGNYVGNILKTFYMPDEIKEISIYLDTDDFNEDEILSFDSVMFVNADLRNLQSYEYFEGHSTTSDITITIQNKNLIPDTIAGWELGSLSTSTGAEITSISTLRTVDFINIEPSKEYILQLFDNFWEFNDILQTPKTIFWYDNTNAFISYDQLSNKINMVTSPSNAYKCRVKINNIAAATIMNSNDIVKIKPMLTLKNDDTFEYEPYKKTTVTINKNFNYIDDSCHDNFNFSTMEYTQKVSTLTIDGTGWTWTKEAFSGESDVSYFYSETLKTFNGKVPEDVTRSQTLRSNMFEGVAKEEFTNNDIEGICFYSDRIRVKIKKSKLSTDDVSGFNTYLASNNLIVYYETVTPVIQKIGQSEIIMTYDAPFYITQNCTGLNSILNLKLAKSVKAVIENNNMFLSEYNFEQKLEASSTYDPPSLADGEGTTTTVTVTGAIVGDYVSASFSNPDAGLLLIPQVTASDTVSVRFQNESGGVLDLASGTLKVRVIKS